MEKEIKYLGAKIKYIRSRLKWKQKELAEKINVQTSSVGQYELGSSRPSLYILRKIAEALNVSTDWLLDDEQALDEPMLLLLSEQQRKTSSQQSETSFGHMAEEQSGSYHKPGDQQKGKPDTDLIKIIHNKDIQINQSNKMMESLIRILEETVSRDKITEHIQKKSDARDSSKVMSSSLIS